MGWGWRGGEVGWGGGWDETGTGERRCPLGMLKLGKGICPQNPARRDFFKKNTHIERRAKNASKKI